MCGLPCTGKTTVAKHVTPGIDARMLMTDEVRRELFKKCTFRELLSSGNPLAYDIQRVFDDQTSIPEEYQKLIWRQNEMVYDELLDRTPALLSRGNVILDGTFSKRKVRERAYSISMDARHDVYLIWCICGDEIIVERLMRRHRATDRLTNVATIEVFNKVKQGFEDPSHDDVAMIVYDSGSGSVQVRNEERADAEEASMLVSLIGSITVEHS